MQTRLSLRYTGPAVNAGLMDAYEAAANMIAFSDFMVAAAKATFEHNAHAEAKVAGFAQGSFVTDMILMAAPTAAYVFSAGLPADHLLEVVKNAFDLWKHLGSEAPQHIEHNGQTVSVTNNNGTIINVQAEALNLVLSDKGGEAAARFVMKALDKDGMDGVQILTEAGELAKASQEEARCFHPVDTARPVSDNTFRLALIIEAPVFKDGNKWRFFDGTASFHADILDEEFLALVNHGARFGKGDILDVEMRVTQVASGAKLSAERSILRVLEHRLAPLQAPLF